MNIAGKSVFGQLKYESGVHRYVKCSVLRLYGLWYLL